MDFDKKLFFDNVSYLVRKSEKKIGDLEKAAGVSPGYISRTSKEGGAKPGIEFVMKISEELKVSMDTLVRTNLQELTQTEKYMISFMKKLRQETMKENLDWERESAESLNRMKPNRIGNVEHPLFSEETFEEENEEGYLAEVTRVVFVSHAFGCHTAINGDCYRLRLKNANWLYLMNVCENPHGIYDADSYAKELWMDMRDGKPQFLCSTKDASMTAHMEDLYNCVQEQSQHPMLKKDVRDVIDAFMNGDVEDDPPHPFGPEVSDEEIPF